MIAVDLFCGKGGWTRGLQAAGWHVVGFDIAADLTRDYPGELVLQDVATISGVPWRGKVGLIVASPPCQAYSYRAMPWKRAKALPPPDNTLFEACFRIAREAECPIVVENVRGAQKWVGRAVTHFGSYYLWGDVPALIPIPRKTAKVPGLANGTFPGGGLAQGWLDQNVGRKVAMNFHEYEKTGKPGRSFQSAAVAECGIKVAGTINKRDGHSHPRHLTNPAEHGLKLRDADGYERNHPAAFGWKSPRTGSGARNARREASALIAMIPFDLAYHIGRVYHPDNNTIFKESS